MMDVGGWEFLFPGVPFSPGKELELNDRRAIIVGLVDARTQFSTQVTLYARYRSAIQFAPGGRNRLSFVIAGVLDGEDPAVVARRITERTGLKASTSSAFRRESSDYIIFNTGIPISFGTVVFLGIVVGIVIVALTFTLFVRDNLKQFASMKAIGVSNAQLIGMVMVQALMVGSIGYALGLGGAAWLVQLGAEGTPALRGFYVPWGVAAFAGAVVLVITVLSGVLALVRVLRADPAEVFRA